MLDLKTQEQSKYISQNVNQQHISISISILSINQRFSGNLSNFWNISSWPLCSCHWWNNSKIDCRAWEFRIPILNSCHDPCHAKWHQFSSNILILLRIQETLSQILAKIHQILSCWWSPRAWSSRICGVSPKSAHQRIFWGSPRWLCKQPMISLHLPPSSNAKSW